MRLRLRLRLRLRVRVRVRVKVRPPVKAHLAQELCGSSGGRCTAPSQEVEDVAEVRALSKRLNVLRGEPLVWKLALGITSEHI